MWSYPADKPCPWGKREGHIVRVDRDPSKDKWFFPKKDLQVLFSEENNDVSDFKIIDGMLYFANGNKVYSFDEESKTLKEIMDAGVYVWSFDITPEGPVVEKKDAHGSTYCIKSVGGYNYFDHIGLMIKGRKNGVKVIKYDKGKCDHVSVVDIYKGAILALSRSYQYKRSALFIWPSSLDAKRLKEVK